MIESEKELIEFISSIQSKTPSTSLLLFRGQTQLYDKIRSGRARPEINATPEVENGWNTIVNRLGNRTSDTKHNQAILQHYGFPTYYVDLTSDPLIASWFACNKYEILKPTLFVGTSMRVQDETTYKEIKSGTGYLFVLEIPNFKEMIEKKDLFDISQESLFVRPKNQSAYLMLDQPPRHPNPNNYIIKTLEIDREKFNSSKTLKELFPSPKLDKGYDGLLDVPYVQMPFSYINESITKSNDDKEDDFDKYFVLAKRAIHIPMYIDIRTDLGDYNPKWKDTVIFEPSSFRQWKTEKFNISEIFEGQNAVFGETAKITISPIAFDKLLENKCDAELSWPLINSNSIFFTRAELDHDKVINHSPPYIGIWLHKDNDLILEIYLISNEDDEIEIELGHAYVLEKGKLEYVKVDKECGCGKPENHIKVISSLLKIHSLSMKQEIALIQHSFGVDKWYVII